MRPDKVRIMTAGNNITHDPYIQGDSQLIGAGTGEGYQKKKMRNNTWNNVKAPHSKGSSQERSDQERRKDDAAGLTLVSYPQLPRSRNSERNNSRLKRI